MKESLKATMLLARYFEQHPDAPDDDPFVVEQRKIAGITPNFNTPKKRRGNRKKIDDEAINRLNQQGLTRVQIADQLDYSVSTVSKHIRRMESNVPRPSHGNRKDIDEQIIKLDKQGLTRNAIA